MEYDDIFASYDSIAFARMAGISFDEKQDCIYILDENRKVLVEFDDNKNAYVELVDFVERDKAGEIEFYDPHQEQLWNEELENQVEL